MVGGTVDRLFVDLGVDGRVHVSSWVEGEFPDSVGGEPPALVWPLDADVLEDLRWYLEDYLRAPFGVYGDRGPLVAAQMGVWGAHVFSALWGGLGQVRDPYVRLRARDRGLEVVLRSASPGLLAMPWELMRDPARPSALALDGVAVSRSIPSAGLGDPPGRRPAAAGVDGDLSSGWIG